MSDPAQAFFHVVRRATSLQRLGQQLYGDSGSTDAKEFLRINGAFTDVLGHVQQGQLLFLPQGACRADEQDVTAMLTGVNRLIAGGMDWRERQILAETPQLVDNAANNPVTLKTVAGIVNSSASGVLSVGRLQVRQVGDLLKGLEIRYKQTFQAHGRLTPEFYAHRQRVFRTLDSRLGRMARVVALGSPMGQIARQTLKVNNKSQILYWNRNGASGGIRDFRGHFEHLRKISRYLRHGGLVTIGIDGMFTGDTITRACKDGDARDCRKSAVVESSGLAGRVSGGAVGASLGYVACNAVLAGPTVGSSLFWCALVVGGAGGLIGSQKLGKVFEDGAEKIFEKKYPVSL